MNGFEKKETKTDIMTAVSSLLAVFIALLNIQCISAQSSCPSLTGWDPSWKLTNNYTEVFPSQTDLYSGKTCLKPFEMIRPCSKLSNPSRTSSLIVQPDGNIVVYTVWYSTSCNWGKGCVSPVWWTGSNKSGYVVRLLEGKFIVTHESDARNVVWEASSKQVGTSLCMQNDGNLVLYDAADKPLWCSGIP
ncbi:hypothetical protein BDR26DRAFT_858672 [Obelidium mucronatum]|nr:hypothetical protein BDR26DRAFT_858672 [Obelidium mucronatum]